MKKTTLILADIHCECERADKIIKYVGADEIISLGDVFDSFTDNPERVKETAEWYVDFVDNPNHIMLWGNHSQHYGFPYRTFQCSGYEQWKYFLINDIVPRSVWEKVKWYHFLDDRWFLCHGGLHKFNLPDEITKFRNERKKFITEISGYLDHEIRKGFNAGAEGVKSWIFNAGSQRGGDQRVGGITWCDFEREFYPIKGLNQIVGHTPQWLGCPKWCVLNKYGKISYHPSHLFEPLTECLDNPDLSFNIDLDVRGNMHWGVWDGKKLTIGSYKDL